MTHRARLGLAISLLGACCAQHAWSQSKATEAYPSKPIRVLVGFSAGSTTDIMARTVGQKMNEAWGQPVVVDNRGGGGGNVGAHLVAKAPPDGHTLLMGSSGPLSVNPVVVSNLPYDSLKDYAPISRVHVVPLVVLAGQKSGIGSIKELIERARANPAKLATASAGTGTTNHFGIELFNNMAGVKLLHVPYKGSGPALAEMLGGQVPLMFDQLSASIGYVRDGRLKALAVASAKRASVLPGVPTLDESGLRGYEASTFIGVLAPAGTPNAVVAQLNAAMRKVMDTAAVRDKFLGLGAEPGSSSPEEFRKLIADELAKWRDVAKKAGLKFD
ncbi:MAG: Bug family tripartite tricarboxylate transporter substrate binding protein [Burkholderiales bacterium]